MTKLPLLAGIAMLLIFGLTIAEKYSNQPTRADVQAGGIGRTSGIKPQVIPTIVSAHNYIVNGQEMTPQEAVKAYIPGSTLVEVKRGV